MAKWPGSGPFHDWSWPWPHQLGWPYQFFSDSVKFVRRSKSSTSNEKAESILFMCIIYIENVLAKGYYDWDGRGRKSCKHYGYVPTNNNGGQKMELSLSLYQWYEPVCFFWTHLFSYHLPVGYLRGHIILHFWRENLLWPHWWSRQQLSSTLCLHCYNLPLNGHWRIRLLDVENDDCKSFCPKIYWNGLYNSPCACRMIFHPGHRRVSCNQGLVYNGPFITY
jgi:hypothetical protein